MLIDLKKFQIIVTHFEMNKKYCFHLKSQVV